MVSNRSGDATTPLGVRDGPDQPVWVCLATMLLQVFYTAGWSGDDVGRTISAAKPTALAKTLDQKELFNK